MYNSAHDSSKHQRRRILPTLLFYFFLKAVLVQSQCSSDDLKPYRECVRDNSPCPCGACVEDPLDDQFILEVSRPQSCNDVLKIFCPLIRCCRECTEEALAWYQPCSANPFSMAMLNTTCELDCGFQKYLDQCMPTATPTFRPTAQPTASWTYSPTTRPTTLQPTFSDTAPPTNAPTNSPVVAPTRAPTKSPVASPSSSPTRSPVENTAVAVVDPQTSGCDIPRAKILFFLAGLPFLLL